MERIDHADHESCNGARWAIVTMTLDPHIVIGMQDILFLREGHPWVK